MTHRALRCRQCESSVGRVYISSGAPQFDWQRDVCFLDRSAVVVHAVLGALADGGGGDEVKREPIDGAAALAAVIADDQRLQVIMQGMQEKTRAALDAFAALEQHLVAERMLPRQSQIWKCTAVGCEESFTREHRLRRHEHTAHGKPGRVTCARMFCELDFADNDEMEAHMVEAHAIDRRARREQAD